MELKNKTNQENNIKIAIKRMKTKLDIKIKLNKMLWAEIKKKLQKALKSK
jgi:hypothetical protein